MRNLLTTYSWKSIVFAIGVVVAGLGCGEPLDGEEQDDADGDTATLHGQLETEGEVEGQIATAYEVDGEGESTSITEQQGEVEADGSFEVVIDLELYQDGEVYVEAEDPEGDESSAEGSVLVEASVEGDAEIDTAPITSETTFETDTFLQAKQEGDWNDDCTTADHRSYITAEAASKARASGEYQSEVEAYARASTSAMRASVDYMMDELDKTRDDIEASFEQRSEARAALDAELLSGDTDSEAAMEAYFEAAADARSDIGLEARDQAREMQASVESFLIASGELSTEVRGEAEAHVEAKRAFFVSTGIEALLEALGTAETSLDSIAEASGSLESEVRSEADAAARADAWATFRAEIENELEGQQQTVFDEIDLESALTTYAEARGDIDAQGSAESIADGCVVALVALWADAEAEASAVAEAHGELLGDADTEAQLLVEIATHLELGARG